MFMYFYRPQTKLQEGNIFLHLSGSHSVYGEGGMHEGHAWQGGMHGRGACMVGGMLGRGCALQGCVCGGGMHGGGRGQGAFMAGWAAHAGEMGTKANGTHPTGLHSCNLLNFTKNFKVTLLPSTIRHKPSQKFEYLVLRCVPTQK